MKKIAIVGNPNSGKSSIFNALTGLRQKVANFPGVTVEKKSGKWLTPDGTYVQLIDFPGTYSFYPTSEDERLVMQVFANPSDENFPDAVVYVADVTHLEKHFLLLTQIIDLRLPCILVLNMADQAEKEGVLADTDKLSDFLGVPVVTVSSRTGFNLDVLQEAIAAILTNLSAPGLAALYALSESEKKITRALQAVFPTYKSPYQLLLLAHHHESLPFLTGEKKKLIAQVCQKEGFESIRQQIEETMQRFEVFTPILRNAIRRNQGNPGLTDRLDAVLTHKIFAPLVFFLVMLLVFQAIYAWAEYPMNLIENGFNELSNIVKSQLPEGLVTDLISDGILSGLGGIFVFVPQIAILFFLITLLEEIGYMARAVFIFDKLMRQFGLNGRSVVALVSGGACAIPAIMSTRTIGNWRERLITILVTPLISCSARIPVYTVLIGFVVTERTVAGIFNLQGLAFMGLYLIGIAAALLSAWVFKKILRSDDRSYLMMQLPPYRLPVWRNVWQTVYEKVRTFVLEAGKVILIVSIILWGFATYGPPARMRQAEEHALQLAVSQGLDEKAKQNLVAAYKMEASYAGHIGRWIEPAIRPLGFDWKIGIAILTSFAAREVFVATMATLYSIGSVEDEATIHNRLAQVRRPDTGEKMYSAATSLSLLIFYVFALQCMSTLAVVRRETGSWKWPLLQFAYMGFLAYLGSLIAYNCMA